MFITGASCEDIECTSTTTTVPPFDCNAADDGSQAYHYFENRIEDARTFEGEQVTLSFFVRGQRHGKIHTCLRQHFDGEDAKGTLSDNFSTVVPIDVTPDWEEY